MARTWIGVWAVMVAGAAWAQPEPDMEAMMKMLGGLTQAGQSTNAPAALTPKMLKEALPKTVPGFERVEAGAEKQSAFGMTTVIATGVYENGEKSLRIEITDLGGMGGLGAMAMLGWANSEVDKETRSGFERTTTHQGFKALESFDTVAKSGEIQVFDGTRISVKIDGANLDSFDELAGAVNAMDLKALSALQPEAPAP